MKSCIRCLIVLTVFSGCAVAQRVQEKLDRAVIAMARPDGQVYVGWRLLATDPEGMGFDVWRRVGTGDQVVKLNARPITQTSNYRDTQPVKDAFYRVVPSQGVPSEWTQVIVSDGPLACKTIPLNGLYNAAKLGLGDLDGDGILDYVIKQPETSLDPGSQKHSRGTYKIEAYNGKTGAFMWQHDLGWNINQGIWFSPAIVYDLDGDGKAEVAFKSAPYAATVKEAVISPGGFVLEGPETCTVLNGQTGQQAARCDWVERGDPSSWGDDRGNRVNRNQIAVACLDGNRPSLLVMRGTYTKMFVDAYHFTGNAMEKVWRWSGDEETPPIRGQGGHTCHVLDIDGDGRDEIFMGSFVLDDDGTCLWRMDMGHPDWSYIADIDPQRPGLEMAFGFEDRQSQHGICVVDPRNGDMIWGCDFPTTHIHDWGLVADIDPNEPGMEIYGMERDGRTSWLFSAQGKRLAENEDLGRHGPRSFYWLDSPVKVRVPFSYRRGEFPVLKYKQESIGTIQGQPIAIADILGDWREEVITVEDHRIRIYTTTLESRSRRVCLMQDPLYRMDVAMQMMGYFYPPQLSEPLFDLPK